MNTQAAKLSELMQPVVDALGYEFVGVECVSQHGHFIVRVYIDTADGIQMEDCEQVSRQLSALLEVEDPISSEYLLEVSSPGLERPLFTREHFERFAGEKVKIKLMTPIESRRNFTGMLQGVADDNVVIEVDGEICRLPCSDIEKAQILPDWSKALAQTD